MKMKAPAKDTVASRSTAFPTDCPNDVTSIIMHADRTTRSVPRAGAVTSPIKASKMVEELNRKETVKALKILEDEGVKLTLEETEELLSHRKED